MTRGAKMLMLAGDRSRSNRDGNREGRMNYDYDVDARFTDRRGREHYDNGRFAPQSNAARWLPPYYDVEINRYEYETPESRGGRMNMDGYHGGDMRRDDSAMRRDEMRMIGFGRENEMRVGSDASVPRYQEMDRMQGDKAMKGGATSHGSPMFDEHMAMEWTQQMQNADGTTGPHWTMEQLEPIMKAKKVDLDPVEFFAAVNMIYSDYGEIIKKRNLGMDFYVDMAKAFLHDKDAGAEDKLAAYYEYVVKGS